MVEGERRNGTFWKGSLGSDGEREGSSFSLSLSPLNKVALRGTIRVGKRRGRGSKKAMKEKGEG